MKRIIRKRINYDSIADYYILRKNDLPNSLDKILNIDFTNKNVLDVACGTGNFTNKLYRMGANVIGIDTSFELLKKAKLNNYRNEIKYIHCSVETLPFKNESFDVVTVLSAWHWFNRDKANNEIFRVLKQGGYLIIMNIDCLKSNENGIERETFNMLKRYCNICYARNGCNKKTSNNIYPELWYNEWNKKRFIIIKNEIYSYTIDFNHDDWKNYTKSSSYYSTLALLDKNRFDNELSYLINQYEKDIFEVKHNLSLTILKK
jgi:ubiquinone/menaquinone biosynthesis C-methylase UbiE